MNTSVNKYVEMLLKEAVEDNVISGGSLLVIKDNKEVLFSKVGYANKQMALPIQRDNIFRIYSMSKPITAFAAMMLMEQGKLDFLDPVSKYLPSFSNQMVEEEGVLTPSKKEILIRDLLSMTSGLVYGDYPGKAGKDTQEVFNEIDQRLLGTSPLGTVEAMDKLGNAVLGFQPGTSWVYGTSADVLGAIIEIASGMRFGTFLKEKIFQPLGMQDTGFYVPVEQRHRLVSAYEQDGKNGIKEYHGNHLGIINKMDRDPAFESGGAGLASTIDDYAKFAGMLLNHGTYNGVQLLSTKMVEYFTSSHLLPQQLNSFELGGTGAIGYSYGNFMRVMIDSHKAYVLGTNSEYGWDGWLGTHFCNSPLDNMTILFMMQKTDTGITPLVYKLRNLVLSAYAK